MKDFRSAKMSSWLPATVDGGYGKRIFDSLYWSIRGSEQLQIQSWREIGRSGNSINGVSPFNKLVEIYADWGRILKG